MKFNTRSLRLAAIVCLLLTFGGGIYYALTQKNKTNNRTFPINVEPTNSHPSDNPGTFKVKI